jgi:hypothetical protein
VDIKSRLHRQVFFSENRTHLFLEKQAVQFVEVHLVQKFPYRTLQLTHLPPLKANPSIQSQFARLTLLKTALSIQSAHMICFVVATKHVLQLFPHTGHADELVFKHGGCVNEVEEHELPSQSILLHLLHTT